MTVVFQGHSETSENHKTTLKSILATSTCEGLGTGLRVNSVKKNQDLVD